MIRRDRLWIRAFRPVDEPKLAAEYLLEHERVLTDIGVTPALASSNRWLSDPSVHLIVAMHDRLGMVAGIRVQPAGQSGPLPMEQAIAPLDSGIHGALRFLEEGGVAEICGLWNAHRFAGRGLPLLLSESAVALASQLNLRSMTCFVAHYTLRHARKVGFVPLEGIGDKGVFTYPIPSIRSIAMVIPDAFALTHASLRIRESIFSLRTRPVQSRLENPAGCALEVNYLLHADNQQLNLRVFGEILQCRHRYSA